MRCPRRMDREVPDREGDADRGDALRHVGGVQGQQRRPRAEALLGVDVAVRPRNEHQRPCVAGVVVERDPEMHRALRCAQCRLGKILMPLHVRCPGVFVDRGVETAPDLLGSEDRRRHSPAGLVQLAMGQHRVEGRQPMYSGDRRRHPARRSRSQPTGQGGPAIVESINPFLDEGDLVLREERVGHEKEPVVPVPGQLLLRQRRRSRHRRAHAEGV